MDVHRRRRAPHTGTGCRSVALAPTISMRTLTFNVHIMLIHMPWGSSVRCERDRGGLHVNSHREPSLDDERVLSSHERALQDSVRDEGVPV